MSDPSKGRREELRRLSELRGQAGLTPYPSSESVEEQAIRQNISRIEAHAQLMHEGERLLQEAAKAAQVDDRATQ